MDPAHGPLPVIRLAQIEDYVQPARSSDDGGVCGSSACHRSSRPCPQKMACTASPAWHVNAASAPPSCATSCAAGGPEPCVGAPERFNGNPHSCHAFLTNCSLLFSLQPSPPKLPRWRMTHPTEKARLWPRRSGSGRRPPAPHFRHSTRNCARFPHVDPLGMPQWVSCSRYGRGGGASWTLLSTFRLWPGTVGGPPGLLADTFLHELADGI